MNYHLDSIPDIYTDIWNIFQKKGMHFIYLNVKSFLFVIDEIRYIEKLTNATVIGLSEAKLGDTVLNSEIKIEGYDLVNMTDPEEENEWLFVKNSISCNQKINFSINPYFPNASFFYFLNTLENLKIF